VLQLQLLTQIAQELSFSFFAYYCCLKRWHYFNMAAQPFGPLGVKSVGNSTRLGLFVQHIFKAVVNLGLGFHHRVHCPPK